MVDVDIETEANQFDDEVEEITQHFEEYPHHAEEEFQVPTPLSYEDQVKLHDELEMAELMEEQW